MANRQDSSSADMPYSRAAYIDEPAIPDYQILHEKTSAVQEIKDLYRRNRWAFQTWQLALFYMFSKEDLAELKANPEAARECGDAAELFGIFLTAGRIPSSYELPTNPAPPASAVVALAPPDVSPGSSKTRGADRATRDSRKRKSSVSSATSSLKKKVIDWRQRASILPPWGKRSSSSEDFGPDTPTITETDPPPPAAPLDKGKGPVTRSATAAARALHDANETDSKKGEETTGQQESNEQSAAAMPSPPSNLPVEHKRIRFGHGFEKRDNKECVVTHRGMAVDRAHIVPFSVNSTRHNLAHVPPILTITERLLGVSFTDIMADNINRLGGTDCVWNIITLTPWLHRMWDVYGLVGFRPCYIDAEPDQSGEVGYIATFTFHWLLENELADKLKQSLVLPSQLSADICFQMVSESKDFSEIKETIFESVYTRGRQPDALSRLQDGHVCRVGFPSSIA